VSGGNRTKGQLKQTAINQMERRGFLLKVGNENLCHTENDLHVRARVFCLIVACPHIITTPLPWIGLPFEDN